MLLSIPSLFASSTASTARAAELDGGREIGDEDGMRVVGRIGDEVGAWVGNFEGLSVTLSLAVVVVVTTVLEVVVATVVTFPATSV